MKKLATILIAGMCMVSLFGTAWTEEVIADGTSTNKAAEAEVSEAAADTIEVTQSANPFLPEWECIPDGEPKVFEDPVAGEQRVYLYGSHDSLEKQGFCGKDYVVWSAPVDDLTDWRFDGTILNITDLEGTEYVDQEGNTKTLALDEKHVLYAPDVIYDDLTGKYVIFAFIAVGDPASLMFTLTSDTPYGPFENPQYLGWGFDPAALLDGDTIYLYYSVEAERACYVAEVDPTDLTLKEETITKLMTNEDDPFYFFEGPSIRKIDNTYVLSYARSKDNGLAEIAYATSSDPYGEFEYGGVIIANDGIYEYGEKTSFGGNNHGGLFEANGQWYQIYHLTSNYMAKRQAMVTPVTLISEGDSVTIERADLNGAGFSLGGLDPYSGFYAASATYFVPTKGIKKIVNSDLNFDPTFEREDYYAVTGLKNGYEIGFSYFDFGDNDSELILRISLKDLQPATVNIYAADYDKTAFGVQPEKELIGTFTLTGDNDVEHIIETKVSALSGLKTIYLQFSDCSDEDPCCELNKLIFVK